MSAGPRMSRDQTLTYFLRSYCIYADYLCLIYNNFAKTFWGLQPCTEYHVHESECDERIELQYIDCGMDFGLITCCT